MQTAQVAHGPQGIAQVGHRHYVGGMFDEIGRLQFEFLVEQGLEPGHAMLDIACGCLRAGRHLIPYLDAGRYMGIDKEADLIAAGLREELPPGLAERKRPRLLVNGAFEFERFGVSPDFALAQSLFTHLPTAPIERCLRSLRRVAAEEGRFYATFFEAEEASANPAEAHDHLCFFFTRDEMARMGMKTGWEAEYIGEWGHPRNQRMMVYRPA